MFDVIDKKDIKSNMEKSSVPHDLNINYDSDK